MATHHGGTGAFWGRWSFIAFFLRLGGVVQLLSVIILAYVLWQIVGYYLLLPRRRGVERGLVMAGLTSEIIGLALVVGITILLQWAVTASFGVILAGAGSQLLLGAVISVAVLTGHFGSGLYYRFLHQRVWQWFAPTSLKDSPSAGGGER